MSEKIKILSVKDSRDWESEDGKVKLVYYTLDIERNGTTQEVDHARQQGKPAPQPGEEIDAIFEPGKFREKMKKALTQGGSGGGKRDWKPREPRSQYDPEDMARQTRSAAQDRALKALTLLGLKPPSTDELKKEITDWTEWFEQSVIAAGQAATQAQGKATPTSTESAPPPSAPPGPESQPADDPGLDTHHLDEILNNLGVLDADSRRWLTEAWQGLPDAKRKKALGIFIAGDREAQVDALAKLKNYAGPVPESYRTKEEVPW